MSSPAVSARLSWSTTCTRSSSLPFFSSSFSRPSESSTSVRIRRACHSAALLASAGHARLTDPTPSLYSCSSELIGSPGRLWDLLQEAAKIAPVAGNTDGSYTTMVSARRLVRVRVLGARADPRSGTEIELGDPFCRLQYRHRCVPLERILGESHTDAQNAAKDSLEYSATRGTVSEL